MMPTLEDLAERAAELDAERVAIAEEHWALTRRIETHGVRQIDQALVSNTRRGIALDAERAAAHRELRQAQTRARDTIVWRAAFTRTKNHQRLCTKIAAALDHLLPLLEAEAAVHDGLVREVGISKLQALFVDFHALREMRRRARLVAEPIKAEAS